MDKASGLETLSITTESLERNYPLFASSLLNLVQNAEMEIAYPPQEET